MGAALAVSRGVFREKRPKSVRDTSQIDKTAVSRRKNAFAQAREEISFIDPDYAEQEKGLFKYYKGTNAITGEVVIGKIPFYELDFEAFRNKRYDSIVEGGNVVNVGDFKKYL